MEYQLPKSLGIIIAVFFSVSVFTCLFLGVSLMIGLGVTLTLAMSVLKMRGIPIRKSLKWLYEGILSIKDIFIVVLLIGVNVSMWISSGIVPGLIYYGFDVVGNVHFLLFAYLMSAVVAFFLGTGLGTISTIGIALFSLGISVGMPKGILVGAIISGAYVADRLSPISALVNFTIKTVDVPFKSYFKKTLSVMIPAGALTAVMYYLLSVRYTSVISLSEIIAYKSEIASTFEITPLLFAIPIAVLWASFRGVNSKWVLGGGILAAAIVTVVLQDRTFSEIVRFSLTGFETESTAAFIQSLEIGGAIPMVEVVLIIMAGISMSTLYEKCGWIQPVIDQVASISNQPVKVLLNTGLLSTGLNALTCDQTVGILVPGKYLKHLFSKYGFDDLTLAQIIANTGTSLAPLMPWNVNAIIILTVTGVGALEYAPYAFLNWFSFPVAIIMSAYVFRKTAPLIS